MNLFKSFFIVSILTFFTKILDFTKDIIIAKFFGANIITDTFFISFKLINILKSIFSEGVFYKIFLPVLIEYKNNKNVKEIKNFISSILGFIIILLSTLILLGSFLSINILKIITPGFVINKKNFILTIKMFKIILPFILTSSISSILIGILNIFNILISPILYNMLSNLIMLIIIIFSNCLFKDSILSLSWSILLGSIFQLFLLIINVYKINMFVLPSINFKNLGLITVLKNIWPVLISMSILQISNIFNTMLISYLSTGSVSYMYYSDKIIDFPLSILSMAINAILFPSLSKYVINKNKKKFSKTLEWGLKLCILLSIPITTLLIILSKPIILSLLKHGKFTYLDSVLTQKILIFYSIGFLGILLLKVLISSFYSHKDTKTILKTSLITTLSCQLINIFLIYFFKENICLYLYNSINSYINSILLFYFLIKKGYYIKYYNKWKSFIIKILISNIIMFLNIKLILIFLNNWEIGGISFRIIKLFILFLISIIIYIMSLVFVNFDFNDIIN